MIAERTRDKYRAVFKRLETDEELRARARATYNVGAYLVTARKVTRYSYYGSYEATEHESVHLDKLIGEALDDALWVAYKMQRRIVEDVQL